MARKNGKESERGMALVLAMIMLIVVLGAVLLVSRQAITAKTQTDVASGQFQLEEACKAGIDHAIQRVWNAYIAGNSNVAGNYASYRTFIDGIVARNASTALVTSSNPVVLDADRGVSVTSITVARTDTINGFDLAIEATGQVRNQSRTARQTVRVGGSPFVGFDYAVLANNINCILCHAKFTNVDLENNTDKTKYGTFDRIKVASLENLMYRPNNDAADSKVAGTIYTRGNVIDSYTGSQMTDAFLAGNNQLQTYPFNAKGKLTQTSTGAMGTPINLAVVAGLDSDGAPLTGGNMYKNYPTDPKLMKDSLLPETFPAPYPDDDGDKVVDSDEFHAISDLLDGAVTGGIVYGVPTGSVYPLTSFPTASNGAATTMSTSGQYNGNLILMGTASNPIQLSGQIAIEGDLMLRGPVKGTGQIFVKGNTYITGDVTYADGSKFGVAADGTKNAMAVITGGNVILGDYQTIRGKNHSKNRETTPTHNPSGTTATPALASGVSSPLSIQVRQSTQTIANVPNPSNTKDAKETVKTGYFDPDVTDGNGIVSTRLGNQQASFTQSELMLFNNLEMQKAVADPSYKPRFYGLSDLAPDNIYLYDNPSSEHAIRYDEGASTAGGTSTKVLKLADYLVKKGYSNSIATRAARLYLRPNGGWLPDSVLRKMWWDDEQSRPNNATTGKYKFDGLLYSNNAIFTIIRSKVRHGSYTEGRLRVRGAIICPDIGVLTAGNAAVGNNSFELQYDARVKDFWAPQDRTQVTFQRQVYDLLAMTD